MTPQILCLHCSEQAVQGRKLCRVHLNKMSAAMQTRRAERKAKGLCYRCDNPRLPSGFLCAEHRQEVSAKERPQSVSSGEELKAVLVSHGVDPLQVEEVLANPPPYGELVGQALLVEGPDTLKGRLLWKFLKHAGLDRRSFQFRSAFNQIAGIIGQAPKRVDPSKAPSQTVHPKAKLKLRGLKLQAAEANLSAEELEIIRFTDLRSREGKQLSKKVRQALGQTLPGKPGPKTSEKPEIQTAVEFIRQHPELNAKELVELGRKKEIHFVRNTVYYARGRNGAYSRDLLKKL